ncbi:hypothetical protein EH223_17320 [candidate division KSB1 bacterium]|nr:hypothetical protein [candidate division KSB1 bacterium]RQW00908.1 MAG: hypothetical protein EH223_17320 [candidate division KSB1 bacterium]
MDVIFPEPILGIMESETYSWDEMERCGWTYQGTKNQNLETLELWNQLGFVAVVNLDGKILSIEEKSKITR